MSDYLAAFSSPAIVACIYVNRFQRSALLAAVLGDLGLLFALALIEHAPVRLLHLGRSLDLVQLEAFKGTVVWPCASQLELTGIIAR